MKIMPVHQRMAELWMIKKKRLLSREEETELSMCLDANANHCYRLAGLYNLSLAASMSNDYEWQAVICSHIEQLEER